MQTLTITDADNFTRDYFKKELNIVLPPPLKTPPPMVVEMAAQVRHPTPSCLLPPRARCSEFLMWR